MGSYRLATVFSRRNISKSHVLLQVPGVVIVTIDLVVNLHVAGILKRCHAQIWALRSHSNSWNALEKTRTLGCIYPPSRHGLYGFGPEHHEMQWPSSVDPV